MLDRFHLLRNLSVALRAIVAHHHGVIRAVGRARVDQEVEAAWAVAGAARPPTAIGVRKQATHAPRRARHSELKRLSEAGASVAGMARALDLDRKTVRVWLRQDAPPSWQRRCTVPTILDPYRDHIEARWQAGCRNAAELARGPIRAGADIRPLVVRDWAMRRPRASTDVMDATPGSTSAPPWRPPSINRTAWLLQADPSTLVADDRCFLDRLRVEAPNLAKSVAVATRFADLERRRSGESLEAWFAAAAATPLAKFAVGLERDREAELRLAQFLARFHPAPGRLGRAFPVDRIALAAHGELDLTEARVRGALAALERIGFVVREAMPGSAYRATGQGLHRKPVMWRFAPEFFVLFEKSNAAALRSRGAGSVARRPR